MCWIRCASGSARNSSVEYAFCAPVPARITTRSKGYRSAVIALAPASWCVGTPEHAVASRADDPQHLVDQGALDTELEQRRLQAEGDGVEMRVAQPFRFHEV